MAYGMPFRSSALRVLQNTSHDFDPGMSVAELPVSAL
jgi:hypothetical protein